MASELLVVDTGATRTLVLNRPEKRNAMNNPMLDAMSEELARAADDDAVRTIVLIGAGDYFCGGRDRNNFDGPSAGQITMQHGLDSTISAFPKVLTQLIESPKPTIAAVRATPAPAVRLSCCRVTLWSPRPHAPSATPNPDSDSRLR